jgi:hypothetical protein
MLAAVMNASFGGDVYQEYHITTEFQKEVARLTEMEDVLRSSCSPGPWATSFQATPYRTKVRRGG